MKSLENTVLIIDDKPGNIFALEQLLEQPGLNFLKAENGKDGLRIALKNEVDLIILDVQMPEMDGFEVAHVLKSNKRTQEIPIIFTSAEKQERESVLQGFEEGAVDFLLKPLDAELTKAKVAGLLTIQQQKRQLVEKNIELEAAEKQIKTLNAALEEQLAQLAQANRDLESFSYSVSHDLRAPVRAMIGYANIIMEDFGKDNAGLQQPAAKIHKSAMKMNQMIDDLLTFAKLGKADVQKQEVNMTSLVEHVVEDIKSGQDVKAEIQLNSLLPAHADRSLLTHVWSNLLSNAIKYSSKKESPRVEIDSYPEQDRIVYSIKDNGAGFSMDYAAKLFGVFQRLHKPNEFEGTGIGLAIVNRIVNRHGGSVWADAKVNEGATFYFSLPTMMN